MPGKRETFGPDGTLGRESAKEAVLTRDLRAALERLNPHLPASVVEDAVRALTAWDASRSTVQHNREFYGLIRGGVPVQYRDAQGRLKPARGPRDRLRQCARRQPLPRRAGARTHRHPHAELQPPRRPRLLSSTACRWSSSSSRRSTGTSREGFDNNLTDYMHETVIAHAFHHNAFLIVSNGDRARYGSITSKWEHFAEWKRLDEADRGQVDAERLLDGMLAHDRLLDFVENFILFDDSRPGGARKIVARNHQVLGVNRAVASVARQEELKRELPPERRLKRRIVELPLEAQDRQGRRRPSFPKALSRSSNGRIRELGRLGVFWHTQGSGKSYSMAFFAEKVRRKLEGNFTFLLMTDRHDLDDQIYATFTGCGIADDNTPRAADGKDLEARLKENHRYIFSLIHKFNRNVDPSKPYSERDDIIVISDEAHRTQPGGWRAICAAPCRTPPSSASPARRCSSMTS